MHYSSFIVTEALCPAIDGPCLWPLHSGRRAWSQRLRVANQIGDIFYSKCCFCRAILPFQADFSSEIFAKARLFIVYYEKDQTHNKANGCIVQPLALLWVWYLRSPQFTKSWISSTSKWTRCILPVSHRSFASSAGRHIGVSHVMTTRLRQLYLPERGCFHSGWEWIGLIIAAGNCEKAKNAKLPELAVFMPLFVSDLPQQFFTASSHAD